MHLSPPLRLTFSTGWGNAVPQQIAAVRGRPYSVSRINDEHLAISRGGYTIPFTRQDVANVFEALYRLLESNPK